MPSWVNLGIWWKNPSWFSLVCLRSSWMPNLIKVLWCTKSTYTLTLFNHFKCLLLTLLTMNLKFSFFKCHYSDIMYALQPQKTNKKISTKWKLFFHTMITCNWKFCQKPTHLFYKFKVQWCTEKFTREKKFSILYLLRQGRTIGRATCASE